MNIPLRGDFVTLEQLQALLAVGRAGSLAEGARRIRQPRTTLQRRIAELEAHLGLALLHRTPAGVVLTPSAVRLVERAQSVIDDVADLAASVREEYEIRGTLRVAYPAGLHPLLLTAAARVLMGALPHVRFRALPGPYPEDPAEADVGFHFGLQPPAGPFVARTIARLPVRLLVGSAYGAPLPDSVDALAAHPVLFWSPDGTPPRLPLLAGGSIPVQPRVVTPDLHFLHHAARAGLGLAWAVDGGIEEPPGVERPRRVLDAVIGVDLPLWLVLPEATRDAPRVQEAVQQMLAIVDATVGAR